MLVMTVIVLLSLVPAHALRMPYEAALPLRPWLRASGAFRVPDKLRSSSATVLLQTLPMADSSILRASFASLDYGHHCCQSSPMECVAPAVLTRPARCTSRSRAICATFADVVSDTDSVVSTVRELGLWAQSRGGQGMTGFVTVHAAAVVLCFPATILFELAAGLCFGFVQGAGLAFAAKVGAGAITHRLASSLAPTLEAVGIARAINQTIAQQPRLATLSEKAKSRGFRLTVLARLSPVPSYVNNYGLALAGVPLPLFLAGTMVATLPAVCTHVYAGSLLSSLASLGDDVPSTPLASSLISGGTLIATALLVQQWLLLDAGGADGTIMLGAESAEPPANGQRNNLRVVDDASCVSGAKRRGGGSDKDGGGSDKDERLLRGIWRTVRRTVPPIITGVDASDRLSGDEDPGAALLNMLFIRLPFLAGGAALAINILLGGGVSLLGGDLQLPEAANGPPAALQGLELLKSLL